MASEPSGDLNDDRSVRFLSGGMGQRDHQLFVWVLLAVIHGILVMRCLAGAPGPPVTEAGTLANIQRLKESKEEMMPGDNVPRRSRLAHSMYALAKLYLETNQLAKADKTIEGLEKSTFISYRDSVVMFLRAKWLRATGKAAEADELEAKARAAEAKELEQL